MENTIATRADLAQINPIDCAAVVVEEDGRIYRFDYTSSATVDGVDVLDVGRFASDHPEYPNQPFMTGRWLAQG